MTGHASDALEVVWPLHRSHYLSPALTDEGMLMPTEPESADVHTSAAVDAATPGRALAVRALLAGADCLQQRVSDLLGVSRRTIGRLADADCSAMLRDPQALAGARTCLEDTASRGSTAEEREAARAWLQQAARDESRGVGVQAVRRRPPGPRPGAGRRARPRGNGAPRNGNGSATATPVSCAPDAPPLLQVEALRRQQQRILHRSALIDYVLAAETRSGGPLTMGDALAELLADITEAAHTIGTLLQATTSTDGDRTTLKRRVARPQTILR